MDLVGRLEIMWISDAIEDKGPSFFPGQSAWAAASLPGDLCRAKTVREIRTTREKAACYMLLYDAVATRGILECVGASRKDEEPKNDLLRSLPVGLI